MITTARRKTDMGRSLLHLSSIFGVWVFLLSSNLYALGLGDIQPHSALNQHLKANIEFTSVSLEELDKLTVTLASPEAFERMKIDRLPLLRKLYFDVVKEAVGKPYIKVSSAEPIREPFLNFLLEVSWSNGQILREYTLLLDPPVFDDIQKSVPAQEIPAVTTSTIAREDSVVRRASPRSTASGYGPTTRSDTLWKVAREMRPDNSVSIPQMMLALLDENPTAFSRHNINTLKAGHILRSPSMEVITSLSKSAAVAETNRQYQQWQQGAHSGAVSGTALQSDINELTDAGKVASTKNSSPQSQARLEIVSADKSVNEAGGFGATGENQNELSGVRQQLAIALEEAEARSQESEELRSRLTDLEKQIASIQRLITLQSDTLGTLQESTTVEPTEVTAQESTVDAPSTAESEAAVEPEAQATPAVVQPSAAVAEKSFIDSLLSDPISLALYVAAPLLVIALLVLFIRRRKQQPQGDGFDSAFGVSSAVSVPAADAAQTEAKRENSEGSVKDSDEAFDSGSFVADFSTSGASAIQAEESEIDPTPKKSCRVVSVVSSWCGWALTAYLSAID